MRKNVAIQFIMYEKTINRVTYRGSSKVAIREGMDFNDSWYLIKYCKHFSLAFSSTSRVALLELDFIVTM